jgi:DNA-binding transcriptional LysR family regulator
LYDSVIRKATQNLTMSHPPLVARQLQDTALRYFLEVVRCGSIREASQRLNVAGSAISRHIAQLEDLLGANLFDRHPRGMVPSAAGEVLAAHALKSAHDTERVVYDIQALHGMQRGRVRITTNEGFAVEFLPKLISDFLLLHPGIQFHMHTCPPTECTRRILHGDADIAVTMSRTAENGIQVEHRQASPVMVAMRHGHPLSQFKSISLPQMLAYPIVLPETNTTVRQLFDIACSLQGLRVEPVMMCNNFSSLCGFLRHHPDGVTISGEISIRYQVQRHELVCVRIRDRSLDMRNVEVQTATGITLSRAAQAFLQHIKGVLSE